MNLDNLYANNIYPLSDIIVYDRENDEVIVSIDRVSFVFTVEEFAVITQQFSAASKEMKKILMSKVQKTDKDQEIN